jgi:hypothetical protein
VNVAAIVVGAGLLVAAAMLLRYPAAVAKWQISGRIETLRRSSLSNAEYVEREVKALRRPESMRLSVWLVRAAGVGVAVIGVVAIVRGISAG